MSRGADFNNPDELLQGQRVTLIGANLQSVPCKVRPHLIGYLGHVISED